MKNFIKYHIDYIYKEYGKKIWLNKSLDEYSDDELKQMKAYIKWIYDWAIFENLKIKKENDDEKKELLEKIDELENELDRIYDLYWPY